MTPTQIRHFRVNYASPGDAAWLAQILNLEGKNFGTRVTITAGNRLQLEWEELEFSP
jgi:hypothetical protein